MMTKRTKIIKNICGCFLNSSIGWLIREISGRKNLGGGMLKAEAVDLKSYPILFDFKSDLSTINKLIKSLKDKETKNSLIEINSKDHIEIDNIVFNKLGYNKVDAKKLVFKLEELINHRVNKSKTNNNDNN